jgi:hypothetical protein
MGEPEAVGKIGPVESVGDEFGFALFDTDEREIITFAFHNEREAQIADQMMSAVLTMAVAISKAE